MVRGLAGAMVERGHVPIIFAMGHGAFLDECVRRGFNTVSLGLGKPPVLSGGVWRRFRVYRYTRRSQVFAAGAFAEAAAGQRVDVVHAIWPNALVLAGEAARLLGVPCIWEVQNILSDRYPFAFNRRLIQMTLARYNFTVLAMSSMVARSLGEGPVRPKLFYLGADEGRFSPGGSVAGLRERLGIPEGSATVAMFVRLVPEKGCDRVIEAVAALCDRKVDLHLLIIGGALESEYGTYLRNFAKESGVERRVHFIGAVPDPESYYGAVDIVASVRIDPEPFGLAVVEAMLMQKPVLVHALGGPAETVADGVTGWHVASPSVESVTRGLTRALSDRSNWPAMGRAGRERALRRFSLARQADQYCGILDDLCFGAGAVPCLAGAGSDATGMGAGPAPDSEGRSQTIAWLIAGDEDGGVAQAVRGLTSAVRPLGIEAIMVSLRDGPFSASMRASGVEVRVLNLGPIPALRGGLASKMRLQLEIRRVSAAARSRLSEALRDINVRAVQVLWPNLMPLAAMAASDASVICFWEIPGVLGKYPFGINRRMIQHTLLRWNVTPFANSLYTASTLGDRPVKAQLLYLGADEHRFDPAAVKAVSRVEIGVPARAVVLGICARLEAPKGQALILEAMAQLSPTFPNLHLLLLGGPVESDFVNQLRALAQRLGLADRLHLVGSVPDPERYYGVIDVAINAYLGAESFGLSVVEAMMMGKPVLVHALGGPAETVVDGQTGWHVHEPTVAGFRAGLLRALGDREKWAAMGAAGRQRALEHFSLSRQAKQYVEIVRKRLGA